MSAEQLITQHINTWTSALQTRSTAGRGNNGKIDLYGIKKLRELILELAVRGKLVPQDPNDEPASELLKRIAAEKAELVKHGKIKKRKPLPKISEDEKPFELPVGWEWTRLGEISEIIRGVTYGKTQFSETKQEGMAPLLRANNIQSELLLEPIVYVDKTLISFEQYLHKGDVLIAMSSGSESLVGKAAQFSEGSNYTFGAFCGVVRPYTSVIEEFIGFFLKTPLYREQTKACGKGIGIKNLNKSNLEMLLVAIPSKNNCIQLLKASAFLLSLCDQLEQQSLTSLEAHAQLVNTLLATLTNSQSAEELAENWARISQHFDTLFTTEASIDALKQTILQLAVMGKLVPQDPNDEPASELLKRIEQEKTQLVKEGKIKKQKPLPPINEDEKPFELPAGWLWCKFGILADFINGDRGGGYPNKNEYVEHGIPWINTGHIEKNGTLSTVKMNFITQKKYDELRSGKICEGDLVYCLRGATFGKTSFVTPYNQGAIASSLMIIRPHLIELGSYIYNYLISPLGKSQIFRFDNGSAQPNLSANSVMLYAFPCPPLKEQLRISYQIKMLSELCEILKSRLRSAQQTQIHLADALTDAALS